MTKPTEEMSQEELVETFLGELTKFAEEDRLFIDDAAIEKNARQGGHPGTGNDEGQSLIVKTFRANRLPAQIMRKGFDGPL